MSNSMFIIIITCAVLFAVYFILYGYFSYRKKEKNAKGVSKVFLVQGILIAGMYVGLVALSLLSPDTLGLKGISKDVASSSSNSNGVKGLNGSVGNGTSNKYEYPSEPIAAGMLTRGDEFLQQNNIQAAINEFKQGIKIEEYKNIFERRMEHALNVKEDYKIYQTALNYFNKGDYESAYGEFKDINPSDAIFYADVISKMEIISSGNLVNSTKDSGGNASSQTGQNVPVEQNTQGNTQTPALP